MLNPSPVSRVFLGASLTVAVALIIFVASSRPSISKQDTQSLLFKPTVDEPQSSESLPSLDSKAQLVESAVETSAISVAKESTDAGNVARSPVNDDATSDSATSEVEPPASSPVVLSADSENTELPQVTTEPNTDRAENSPAQPLLAASPAPETTEPQAEKKNAEKKNAEKKNAEKKPAKQSEKEQAKKKPSEEQSQEPPSTEVRDPMKRLSREFARRAAAKEGAHTKAVPVAPPANEIFPPTVTMSDTHRKSCVVFVGDAMPAGDLQESAGEQRSVQKSLGKSLTAVVFWNTSNPYALDQFEELQQDLVPFAELGVQTIAIHVGPEPANYAELCQRYAEGVLCLVDPDKSYFQKVASDRLPRTYLLDASGKIIWLDIEYSRTTRYELRNALHFSLQDK